MKVLLATLLIALYVVACSTTQTARPIDPETLGMVPYTGKTKVESQRLQQDALNAYRSVFGDPRPTSIMWDGPVTGWFTPAGQLSQLRAGLKMLRADFHARFLKENWKEIPVPRNYLSSMHLPSDTPRKHMTCYLGQVNGKPAYLFWSDDAQTMMLVFDY